MRLIKLFVAVGTVGLLVVACNSSKSGKKQGGSNTNTFTGWDTYTDTYTGTSTSYGTSPLSGITCTSEGNLLNGGDKKTYTIDTALNKMRIQSAAATEEYTLQPANKAIYAPTWPRYEVIVASGANKDTGHISIDPAALSGTSGQHKAIVSGIPFNSKVINVGYINCPR